MVLGPVFWRLEDFDQDSRAEKHQFLGTIGNFLKNGAWLYQRQPTSAYGSNQLSDQPEF